MVSGWDYIIEGAIFGGWKRCLGVVQLSCFFIDLIIASVAEIQSYGVLFSTLEMSCLQPVWSWSWENEVRCMKRPCQKVSFPHKNCPFGK